jgi:hypothetical protein
MITQQGVSYNYFFSLQERTYTWNEVENAHIYLETGKREGRLTITPYFSISTKEDKFYIWKGFGTESPSPDTLEQIVMQLYAHNVTIYITPMNEQQAQILLRMSRESQELGKRMFVDIQEKIDFKKE